MAVTKIHAIRHTVDKAIDYIINPKKTDYGLLTYGYNTEPDRAAVEFEITATLAAEARNSKKPLTGNKAYHIIQSFGADENLTPEQVHEMGKQLAAEFTQGKFEYVVATHIDKDHRHNHIIINAVSFLDYNKIRTVPYRTARQIRTISDRLCMERGLRVYTDPQEMVQGYSKSMKKRYKTSNRTEVRRRLNFCLKYATTYEDFKMMALELGITIDDTGKHMAYRYEGASRNVRDSSLSDTEKYTKAGILELLEDNRENPDLEQVPVSEIKERYEQKVRTVAPADDTLVQLSQQQILSANSDAIQVSVADRNGNSVVLVLDSDHVTSKPTGEIFAAIGSQLSYDVIYPDGKHGDIHGGELIQHIEQRNGVEPIHVELSPDVIKSMSLRGVTVTLPQAGIEKAYIPNEFVIRNPAEGKCSIVLYPNWDYSIKAPGQANVRTVIKGQDFVERLVNHLQPGTNDHLRRRIGYVDRMARIQNAKLMARTFSGMKSKGKSVSFVARIQEVRTKQQEAKAKISEYKANIEQYGTIAKCLKTLEMYSPLQMEYTHKSGVFRNIFYKKHQAELEAYRVAATRLETMGVPPTVESAKVQQLIATVREQISREEQQIAALQAQERELLLEQETARRIQEDYEQERESEVNHYEGI